MSEKKITFGRIFWPTFWAALAISIIGAIIWLFIIFGIIGSFGQKKPYSVKNNTVLHMTLDGNIGEIGESNFNPSSFSVDQRVGLSDILNGLKIAEEDDRIEGIFLEIDNLSCGYSTARQIRKAINKFEKSGKWVVAYNSGEIVTQKELYLSSAADESYGFPTSNVELLGLGAELSFFKNTLDKLEIEMQVIRGSNNDFKSAVEPFFRDAMSDSSRLQIERYLNSMWGDIRTDIAKDTKASSEMIDSIANHALVKDVNDAVKYKLLKSAKYRDEVMSVIAKKVKVEKPEDVELASFAKYAKKKVYNEQTIMDKSGEPNIAVILAEGAISTDGDGLTSKDVCQLFRDARANESVKTVVFRINSPGGSALASDEIWREVKLTNKTKKVIVSMGDVAASGGYYIAAPASTIFAEPTTITGSIGVFGVIPFTGKMMENKLGITFDRASTNNHSVITTNRKLSDEEFNMIQESVDDIYDQFKSRVADGRKMTKEEVDVVARGRVWTGRDALKINLVDKLGGLQDAIDFAAKKAKIKDQKVLYYPIVEKDFLSDLMEELEALESMKVSTRESQLPEELVNYYKQLKEIESFNGIQMRMPYQISIN
jgi:protease-4